MGRSNRRPVEIGETFERLTVMREVGKNSRGGKKFLCKCQCGNEVVTLGADLRFGHVRSCGCLFKEVQLATVTKHGMRYSRIYETWRGMKQRCYNEKKRSYKNYGGRGITVCDEWKNDFQAFYGWAMANGYSDELTIDRIDVDGNYEPSNCRWASTKIQANNKSTSRYIEAFGEIHTVAEWAELLGIKKSTIYSRLRRGCEPQKALMKCGEA